MAESLSQPNPKTVGPSVEQKERSLLKSSSTSFQNIKSEDLVDNSPSDSDSNSNVKKKLIVVELIVVMSAELDLSSIQLMTEKLDVNNFSMWRWGIFNTLGHKNLDDYILKVHTPEMKSAADYELKTKQVTNFIRMHLSHSNLESFVPDICDYNPKALWDAIVSHFAAKKVENSANALDHLLNTQFIEGNMEKSVNTFREAFCRVFEVSSKFDKLSLEAVAVVFALTLSENLTRMATSE
jgi:hypothetical protein